jgi:hypothetical protein
MTGSGLDSNSGFAGTQARSEERMTTLAATTFTFPASAFVPLAVGFFGLGTGYLIYGPEELFGQPERSRPVDITTGIWGIWMPGFLQFLTGAISGSVSCGSTPSALRCCTWRHSRSRRTGSTGSRSGSRECWVATRGRTCSWRSRSRCSRCSGSWSSSRQATGRSGCSSSVSPASIYQRLLRHGVHAPSSIPLAAEGSERMGRAGAWLRSARHGRLADVPDLCRDTQRDQRHAPPSVAPAFVVLLS